MISTFVEFVSSKQRKSLKDLKLIKRVLKVGGFQVESHLHTFDDPFLFVYNPFNNSRFNLRVYKLGDREDIFYRIQKTAKTHPWGGAGELNIKEIFEDVTSDSDGDDDENAKKIIKAICDDIKSYLKETERAEKKGKVGDSPLGSVAIRSSLDIGDGSIR